MSTVPSIMDDHTSPSLEKGLMNAADIQKHFVVDASRTVTGAWRNGATVRNGARNSLFMVQRQAQFASRSTVFAIST